LPQPKPVARVSVNSRFGNAGGGDCLATMSHAIIERRDQRGNGKCAICNGAILMHGWEMASRSAKYRLGRAAVMLTAAGFYRAPWRQGSA
jgi:hypothetical protein